MELVFYADSLDTTNQIVSSFLNSTFSMCLCTIDHTTSNTFMTYRGSLPSRVVFPDIIVIPVIQNSFTTTFSDILAFRDFALNTVGVSTSRNQSMFTTFMVASNTINPVQAFSLIGPCDVNATTYDASLKAKKIFSPQILMTDNTFVQMVILPTDQTHDYFRDMNDKYLSVSNQLVTYLSNTTDILITSTMTQLSNLNSILTGTTHSFNLPFGTSFPTYLKEQIIITHDYNYILFSFLIIIFINGLFYFLRYKSL